MHAYNCKIYGLRGRNPRQIDVQVTKYTGKVSILIYLSLKWQKCVE